jgi:hypothetical protein
MSTDFYLRSSISLLITTHICYCPLLLSFIIVHHHSLSFIITHYRSSSLILMESFHCYVKSFHYCMIISLCLFVSLSLCLFVSLSLCFLVSLSLCIHVSIISPHHIIIVQNIPHHSSVIIHLSSIHVS